MPKQPVRSVYQPPASSTFLSEQTSNQPAVLFSQNKSPPAISHQPTEHAADWYLSTRRARLLLWLERRWGLRSTGCLRALHTTLTQGRGASTSRIHILQRCVWMERRRKTVKQANLKHLLHGVHDPRCSDGLSVLFVWLISDQLALFVWLISHQPAVIFSQNKPATSNQRAVLFSRGEARANSRGAFALCVHRICLVGAWNWVVRGAYMVKIVHNHCFLIFGGALAPPNHTIDPPLLSLRTNQPLATNQTNRATWSRFQCTKPTTPSAEGVLKAGRREKIVEVRRQRATSKHLLQMDMH
jgi:hypothetical protein